MAEKGPIVISPLERASSDCSFDVRVYTEADIKGGGLPIILAGQEFILPIKEPVPGVKFAWLHPLDPKQPELGKACALETGFRLAQLMGKNNAVLIEPPSEKSKQMAEAGAQIAANLTGKDVYLFQAGGGLIKDATKDFDIVRAEFLNRIDVNRGEISQPKPVILKTGNLAWVSRYMPVTGKNKYMFLTADQLAQIRKATVKGTIVGTIEDVITTGTTVETIKRLKNAGDVRQNNFQTVAVAREGDEYSGPASYAIQIPKL